RFLGLEVMIERLPRQACGLRRLLDRGTAKAVPAEHGHRGLQNAGARAHLTNLTLRAEVSNNGLVLRDPGSRARSQLPVIQGSMLATSQLSWRNRDSHRAGQFVGNRSHTCPAQGRDIMITFNRVHAGLVASGVFALGLFCVAGAAVTQATPVL